MKINCVKIIIIKTKIWSMMIPFIFYICSSAKFDTKSQDKLFQDKLSNSSNW